MLISDSPWTLQCSRELQLPGFIHLPPREICQAGSIFCEIKISWLDFFFFLSECIGLEVTFCIINRVPSSHRKLLQLIFVIKGTISVYMIGNSQIYLSTICFWKISFYMCACVCVYIEIYIYLQIYTCVCV